jgi:ribosomal protein S18 acetylase RimI-like enzyme
MSASAARAAATADPAIAVTRLEVLAEPRLSQVLQLEQESFPPCEQLGAALMRQQAALRTSGLLIAELGATFAGYLLFSRTAGSGLITKLAVASPFRRRGIGSALLRHGISELERPGRRHAGTPEIMLHVDPSRTGAQRIYEAFGFKQAAVLPDYYSDARDAVIMKRVNPQLEAQLGKDSAP